MCEKEGVEGGRQRERERCVAGDSRLMEAMLEVETLTTDMETQRAHNERQVGCMCVCERERERGV